MWRGRKSIETCYVGGQLNVGGGYSSGDEDGVVKRPTVV